MSILDLSIDGMSCHQCSSRLQRVLEANDGIYSAEVILDSKKVTIQYDASSIDINAIQTAISDAGFTVMPPS